MRVKETYQVLKLRGTKRVKCSLPECRQWLTRSKTFEMTVNPFNKNKSGHVKTQDEVYEDLRAAVMAWRKDPNGEYCKDHSGGSA